MIPIHIVVLLMSYDTRELVLSLYVQLWGGDPKWNHIGQTTLKEVETSWAHSRCREVVFDITDTKVSVYM